MNASNINTKKARLWLHAILPLIYLLIAAHLPLVVNGELSAVDEDLFAALREEDIAAASAALAAGANINAISPSGQQTPLMQSVLHGRPNSVSWCLTNGADTTIAEKDGYTPMHGAAFQGHPHIAELLMKHGVPLRDLHNDGHEPAIRACWGSEPRHLATLHWFLEHGVPLVDIYDKCIEMTKNENIEAYLRGMMSSYNQDEL
ncbi:hypothetical protein ACHAXA_001587 [Cyclostephanos tholiformis]|uniref:Ankyrin repeat domain-containing protein n=1 Tax=Cyclostephanos tholiformis TaxID=382380 RepID=A0ABD3RCM0_9STRA